VSLPRLHESRAYTGPGHQHVPQSSLIVCPRRLSLGRCCGTDCHPNGFNQGAHDIGCTSKVRRQA
jgi:hypothetical protein